MEYNFIKFITGHSQVGGFILSPKQETQLLEFPTH